MGVQAVSDSEDFIDWLICWCRDDPRVILVLALMFVTLVWCAVVFLPLTLPFGLGYVLMLENSSLGDDDGIG